MRSALILRYVYLSPKSTEEDGLFSKPSITTKDFFVHTDIAFFILTISFVMHALFGFI